MGWAKTKKLSQWMGKAWNALGIAFRVGKALVWVFPSIPTLIMYFWAEFYGLPAPVFVTLCIGVFTCSFGVVILYKMNERMERVIAEIGAKVNDRCNELKDLIVTEAQFVTALSSIDHIETTKEKFGELVQNFEKSEISLREIGMDGIADRDSWSAIQMQLSISEHVLKTFVVETLSVEWKPQTIDLSNHPPFPSTQIQNPHLRSQFLALSENAVRVTLYIRQISQKLDGALRSARDTRKNRASLYLR